MAPISEELRMAAYIFCGETAEGVNGLTGGAVRKGKRST